MLLSAGGSAGLHGLQCQALNNATVSLMLYSLTRHRDGGYLARFKLVTLMVEGVLVQIGQVKYSTKINGMMDLLTLEQILPPQLALFN